MDSNPIVVLDQEQTRIDCEPSVQRKAISTAFNITMSPHEHEWNLEEQRAMAAYCLWAHQRLCAIEQCVSGTLEHQDDKTAGGGK